MAGGAGGGGGVRWKTEHPPNPAITISPTLTFKNLTPSMLHNPDYPQTQNTTVHKSARHRDVHHLKIIF
jgi:hypothetical protein